MFIRVVLPLPFSPSRDKISPRLISREMLSLAVTLPNRLVMFRNWTAATVSKKTILSAVWRKIHGKVPGCRVFRGCGGAPKKKLRAPKLFLYFSMLPGGCKLKNRKKDGTGVFFKNLLTSGNFRAILIKLTIPRRANAGVAQWSGHQPSKLGMRVRFSSPAPIFAPVAQVDRATAF